MTDADLEPLVQRRPPTWRLALVVPLVALIAIAVTRVAEGPSTAAAAARTTSRNTVTIRNFAFVPARLSVASGTVLTVTNADSTTHTLSARNGSFDAGAIAPGATNTIRIGKSGTFAYFCKFHPSMRGTLVVK